MVSSLARCIVVLAMALGVTADALGNSDHSLTASSTPKSSEAYATLVYGESFVLGARVLGQSLRDAGTTRDMVALTTGSLSAASELTLAQDGWRVIHVPPVVNPGRGPQAGTGFPSKFKYVYTKLYIFKLIEYKKVVFVDADALVTQNMDSIFKCPGFCAALRHSERFNTGVMVLEPSLETYNDMMTHIRDMPSYTGGDQGFLNSYFSGFAHAPLFEPKAEYTSDQYKYMRLPTTFNADIGLYVVGSNHWMIPRESIFVIHYTLGPFKPWAWWTSWLVRETPAWDAARYRLPADARNLRHGRTARQLFSERWLVAIPWGIAIALLYLLAPAGALLSVLLPAAIMARLPGLRARLMSSRTKAPGAEKHNGGGGGTGNGGATGGGSGGAEVLLRMNQIGGGAAAGAGGGAGGGEAFPRLFVVGSIAAGYGCVILSTIITILLVPYEVAPLYGWLLSYEWGFLLLAITYGFFLSRCHAWGRQAGPHPAMQHGKAAHVPWTETITSATFLVLALLVAPWAGRLLGISSFVTNIIATVFVGLGAIVVVTVQFLFLPVQWYVAGRMAAVRGD